MWRNEIPAPERKNGFDTCDRSSHEKAAHVSRYADRRLFLYKGRAEYFVCTSDVRRYISLRITL